MILFRCEPDDDKKNLIIETNDISVRNFLEYTVEERSYSPWTKVKWLTKAVKHKIYDRYHQDKLTGHDFYLVGIGWAAYIIMIFKDIMSQDDYQSIVGAIYRDTYRTTPFPELRDIQNQDVLHILKYRRALASLYTGYGKSQIIAVLAKYYYQDLGKKVLIVTPQTKPRDELTKRIKNLYGIEVSTKIGSGNLQAMITNGLMNRKETKDKALKKAFISELQSFDVVLVDEVEYTINPGGFFIYNNIKSDILYGFSGTSDKTSGKLINLRNGLTDPTVSSNADLIKYFGPALVYRQPLNLEVDVIRILTPSMNKSNLNLDEICIKESSNIYLDFITKIFTNPEVCKTIVRIAKKFPLLFIPINNLQNIINNWIEHWFIGKFRILLVCFQGYLYYDLQGNITSLTLQEACDKIKAGEVDIIPSTSSGFRALDFPCLRNILIFTGKIAGSVLQSVGRIARQDHMNIISLEPEDGKPIPIHTKQQKIRMKLIDDYYKFCKINHKVINEQDLKNYSGIC